MRTGAVLLVPALFGVGSLGCGAEKDAMLAGDPGSMLREETVNRIGPPSRATSRTVRCGCDADGDLYVRAPQGSKVLRPEDGTYAAEAEVVLPEDTPDHVPLRRTKSLGFIGDGKLGESRPRGGPWAAPDALLPPHRHVEPRYGATGWGYRPHHYVAPSTSWSSAPTFPPSVWGSPSSPWGSAPSGSMGPAWR